MILVPDTMMTDVIIVTTGTIATEIATIGIIVITGTIVTEIATIGILDQDMDIIIMLHATTPNPATILS